VRSTNSIVATPKATTICGTLPFTVVGGSVIMKNVNSWYIGPVIGAISAR